MPLSDTAIRKARPAEKPYKLPDEKGLYLLVTPAGGKLAQGCNLMPPCSRQLSAVAALTR